MKFSTVALGVEDLDRSIEFYVDGLGLAIHSRPQPDLVYLSSGETRIALYPAEELAAYAGVPVCAPGGVVLSLNVEPATVVDELIARCLDHGGSAIREAAPMDWGGYAGTVSDPDGHVWEIVCAG